MIILIEAMRNAFDELKRSRKPNRKKVPKSRDGRVIFKQKIEKNKGIIKFVRGYKL